MIYSGIAGTGSYLPEKVLTNHDLPAYLETSHDWIVQRTGIEQRHIANQTETVAFMGAKAARQALAAADCSIDEVDLIVVASCSNESIFPSTACLIQEILAIPNCAALDVQAACSGFIYALSMAQAQIQIGQARCALVIGSEAMSRVVDWTDRSICVLFGDGAGAVVLKAQQQPGIWSTHLNANGRQKDILYLKNCATEALAQQTSYEKPYMQMLGREVFKVAVRVLEETARTIMARHQLEISDIQWLISHQANRRIIEATAEKLGLSQEQLIITVNQHSNTSTASIPLALDQAVRLGQIQRGDKLLLVAVGGGMAWGSALVTY